MAINNDNILSKIGLSNLNNHNIISCTHEDNEDSDSPINVGDNEDYSTCFTNDTKDKFVEIDKANKKCHIYTTLDCKNNDNKGKLVENTDFSNKTVFYKKSRDILFKLPNAPAEQITILSNYINILNDNNTNGVLSNRQHFRGDISTINDSLKTNINDSKHLNINDTFCCLAEHLSYHDYILIHQMEIFHQVHLKQDSMHLISIYCLKELLKILVHQI